MQHLTSGFSPGVLTEITSKRRNKAAVISRITIRLPNVYFENAPLVRRKEIQSQHGEAVEKLY